MMAKRLTNGVVATACVVASVVALAEADVQTKAPELVRNGGFEDVADGKTVGWNAIGRKFVYRDGEGINGTRALCYENDDPSFYSFPGQSVPLKAGHAYEYQVWVKTENLSGEESGATICIEWCNSDGKWLGGAYVNGVKGTKDWTLVKGITDKVPKEAATANTCCRPWRECIRRRTATWLSMAK